MMAPVQLFTMSPLATAFRVRGAGVCEFVELMQKVIFLRCTVRNGGTVTRTLLRIAIGAAGERTALCAPIAPIARIV